MIKMIGRIVNFRGGRRTHHTNQMILELDNEISSKRENLVSLMGKKVVYKAKTHDIVGTITRIHGKREVVARFNRGMPGQAIGSAVEIITSPLSQSPSFPLSSDVSKNSDASKQ